MLIGTVLAAVFANSPDLCADVYLDATGEPYKDVWGQMLPRYCQWTGPGAPVLDADICCTIDGDGAHCSIPDVNGRCALGFKMYCAYGEVMGEGVTCYQPFPSACDHDQCATQVEAPEQAEPEVLCCYEQGCYHVSVGELWACEDSGGVYFWCDNGVSNSDGTTDCLE